MLYYKDGTTEVQLGDKVKIRRFLILNYSGVVCYLPGLSTPHPSMVMEGMDLWAVQDNGGNLFMMPYDEDTPVPASVSFVERGSVEGIGLAPLGETPVN
ncbi:MAG: hypothetical protein ACAI35_09985 [Candidatus Methylacidiphilales bacterium]|nr:hypothetical protein [Candidatus Methylacidiphilales bacterium]